jgi:hypothetical protein
MRSSRIALGGFGYGGIAAIAASLGLSSGVVTGRNRSIGKPTALAARYTAEAAAIETWNHKVDEAKARKNITFGRRKERSPKKRMLPAPSNRGATIIGDLIFNYQVHSNNVMNEFTGQRAKEYMRRVGGRSIDGVKAEAEHLHRARNKHQKKVSRMIGGRTLRVIQQLSNNQQQHFEEKRQHDWQLWTPIDNGIWQYQVHDEVFPYFMFNDETGNLFEFDPARLHFECVEDANVAAQYYVDWVNAKTESDKEAREKDFKDYCEQYGHTLTAATNTISADEAGDENYALEG